MKLHLNHLRLDRCNILINNRYYDTNNFKLHLNHLRLDRGAIRCIHKPTVCIQPIVNDLDNILFAKYN